MHRERGFAAVPFDNGNNFVLDEFARGLPDEFFLVVELRIKIDKIHTGILGHFFSLIGTAKRNNSAVRFLRQGKKPLLENRGRKPARRAKMIPRNYVRLSQGKFFRNIVPRISGRTTAAMQIAERGRSRDI